MYQQNVNPYNPKKYEEYFKTTDLYQILSKDYDVVSFDDDVNIINGLTTRSILSLSIFDAASFYYLQYLMDLNPSKIYDIGCWSNLFKKYIPNLIGIDVLAARNYNDSNADLYLKINNSFYEENFEKMEAAFAINSLHFYPIKKIRERVIQFSSLISKGGRGFITFNAAIMLERQVKSRIRLNSKLISRSKIKKIENFVRKELYNLPFQIEVFECSITRELDACLTGNIRIVFTK